MSMIRHAIAAAWRRLGRFEPDEQQQFIDRS
jgi:hypothetical protein